MNRLATEKEKEEHHLVQTEQLKLRESLRRTDNELSEAKDLCSNLRAENVMLKDIAQQRAAALKEAEQAHLDDMDQLLSEAGDENGCLDKRYERECLARKAIEDKLNQQITKLTEVSNELEEQRLARAAAEAMLSKERTERGAIEETLAALRENMTKSEDVLQTEKQARVTLEEQLKSEQEKFVKANEQLAALQNEKSLMTEAYESEKLKAQQLSDRLEELKAQCETTERALHAKEAEHETEMADVTMNSNALREQLQEKEKELQNLAALHALEKESLSKEYTEGREALVRELEQSQTQREQSQEEHYELLGSFLEELEQSKRKYARAKEADNEVLKERTEEVERLRKKLAELQEENKALRDASSQARHTAERQSDMAEEGRKATESLATVEKRAGELEESLRIAREESSHSKEEVSKLVVENDKLFTTLTGKVREIERLSEENRQLNESIKALQGANGVLSTPSQEAVRKEAEQLEKENATLSKNFAALKEEYDRMTTEFHELDALRSVNNELTGQVKQLREFLTAATSEREKSGAVLCQTKDMLEKTIAEKDRFTKECASKAETIELLHEELSRSEEQLASIQAACAALTIENNGLKLRLKNIEEAKISSDGSTNQSDIQRQREETVTEKEIEKNKIGESDSSTHDNEVMSLKKEVEKLTVTIADLSKEHEVLLDKCHGLETERDRLTKELDGVQQSLTNSKHSIECTLSDNGRLATSLSAVTAEKEKLSNMLHELTAQLQITKDENVQMQKKNEEFVAQIDLLTKKNDELNALHERQQAALPNISPEAHDHVVPDKRSYSEGFVRLQRYKKASFSLSDKSPQEYIKSERECAQNSVDDIIEDDTELLSSMVTDNDDEAAHTSTGIKRERTEREKNEPQITLHRCSSTISVSGVSLINTPKLTREMSDRSHSPLQRELATGQRCQSSARGAITTEEVQEMTATLVEARALLKAMKQALSLSALEFRQSAASLLSYVSQNAPSTTATIATDCKELRTGIDRLKQTASAQFAKLQAQIGDTTKLAFSKEFTELVGKACSEKRHEAEAVQQAQEREKSAALQLKMMRISLEDAVREKTRLASENKLLQKEVARSEERVTALQQRAQRAERDLAQSREGNSKRDETIKLLEGQVKEKCGELVSQQQSHASAEEALTKRLAEAERQIAVLLSRIQGPGGLVEQARVLEEARAQQAVRTKEARDESDQLRQKLANAVQHERHLNEELCKETERRVTLEEEVKSLSGKIAARKRKAEEVIRELTTRADEIQGLQKALREKQHELDGVKAEKEAGAVRAEQAALDLRRVNNENAELKSALKGMKGALLKTQGERDDLEKKCYEHDLKVGAQDRAVEEQKRQVAERDAAISKKKEKIKRCKGQIAELESQLERARAEKAETEDSLAAQVTAAKKLQVEAGVLRKELDELRARAEEQAAHGLAAEIERYAAERRRDVRQEQKPQETKVVYLTPKKEFESKAGGSAKRRRDCVACEELSSQRRAAVKSPCVKRRKAGDVRDTAYVLFSGFAEGEEKTLRGLVRRLGGHVASSGNFSDRITHVVVPTLETRTVKTCSALVSGKWVVSARWLEDSKQAGTFVAPEPYGEKGGAPLSTKRFCISSQFCGGGGGTETSTGETPRSRGRRITADALRVILTIANASVVDEKDETDFTVISDNETKSCFKGRGTVLKLSELVSMIYNQHAKKSVSQRG